MCRLARSKARRAGANVNISPADMRTFRLPEPVDLITCEFDAVNHVPRKSDLARVASAFCAPATPLDLPAQAFSASSCKARP